MRGYRGRGSRRRGASQTGTADDPERRGQFMPLGDALSEYLSDTGLLKRKKIQPAFDAWNDAVGPGIAQQARPVSYRRGELIVEVDSTALLSELRGFASEDLRTRADALLEGAKIRKLTFKLKRRT